MTAHDVDAKPAIEVISTSGLNLDDFQEEGEYYFGPDFTPINIPTGVNGWLSVRKGIQDPYVVKQIWYRTGTLNSNDYQTFVRTYANNDVGWGRWVKYSTSRDVCFNLADLGISEFPTTMKIVSESMKINSLSIVDSRSIVSEGEEEISDLQSSLAGMYMFMKGNSTSRLGIVCIYTTAQNERAATRFGSYAHSTDQVLWSAISTHSPNYIGSKYDILDDTAFWVNPPNIIGLEYRTHEYWDTKTVYTKLIDFGTLPKNGTKTISHNCNSTRILRCIVSTSSGSIIPGALGSDGGSVAELFCNNSIVSIKTSVDASSQSGTVQIWYIKD